MKRLITTLLLLAAFVSFNGANAQSATLMPLAAGDTVVNTATVTKVFSSTAGHSAIGVQINLNKISGTVAGTTKLQGSLNNVDWEDIGSAFTNTDIAKNAKAFTLTGGSPYTYYRVNCTGSGTMSAQLRVWFVKKD